MTPRLRSPRPSFRLLAALCLSAALLSGCRDQNAAQQNSALSQQVKDLTQERDRLNARITAEAEQRAEMQTQLDTLRSENDRLKVQIAQGTGASGGTSATTPSTSSSSTGSSGALGADPAPMVAARTYAKNVYAALQARIAEDPMYTPEAVAKATPDCTQATAIGENGYGQAPAGVDKCTIEPAGDHDFTVTLDVSGQQMVVGPGAQP